MCDVDPDGYSPEFFETDWRRARKNHRCCACGETITAGVLYHYTVGKWDGDLSDFKHCARCWRMFCFLETVREPGSVDVTLNCGEVYDGDPNDPAHAMAFMTTEEAQRFAERDKRRRDGNKPKHRDKLQDRAEHNARWGNLAERRARDRERQRLWDERNRRWTEGRV